MLREGAARLAGHAVWIGTIVLACAALGLLAAMLWPPTYTAATRIVDAPRGTSLPGREGDPLGAPMLATTPESVLQSVIQQEGLAEDPDFTEEPRHPWTPLLTRLFGARQPAPVPDPATAALRRLAEAVAVRRTSDGSALDIAVTAGSADKAMRLARAVATAMVKEADRPPPDTAQRATQPPAPPPPSPVDALRAELQRADGALDALKRLDDPGDRPVGPAPAPRNPASGVRAGELQAAHARVAELQARLDEITRTRAGGAIPTGQTDTLPSKVLAALLDRYAGAVQQRDGLATTLGPRHPTLRAATAQLKAIRKLIAQETARIAATTGRDLARAMADERSLARQTAALATAPPPPDTTVAAIQTARLRDLEREAAGRRAASQAAIERSREAPPAPPLPLVDQQEPRHASPAILGPSDPPIRHGMPAPVLVALAASAGLFAAVAATLARGAATGRLTTPRALARASGLPVLAVVDGRDGPQGPGLQALRHAVMDAAPEQPPRVVLLLSATAAVAALAVPLDLARTGAAAGEAVLLVDADDDRLTRALSAAGETERRGWTAVRRTAIRHLSVLVWSAPFIGASAKDGRGGAESLRHFAADHDVVLIHAPVGNDSVRLRPLAAAVTTIVVLADAGATTQASLDALRASLGPYADKLAGFAWVLPQAARRPAPL